MVPFLLLPNSFTSGELGKALSQTAFTAGVIGALITTYLWLRGLGYAAKSDLPFPVEFGQAARNNLALNVYWHSRIKVAIFFAALYPWFFLGVILSDSTSKATTQTTSSSYQSPPFLLGIFILILIYSITLLPALATNRIMRSRLLPAKLCEELCIILNHADTDIVLSDETPSPILIADPLGDRRPHVAQIAGDLADMARLIDAIRLTVSVRVVRHWSSWASALAR